MPACVAGSTQLPTELLGDLIGSCCAHAFSIGASVVSSTRMRPRMRQINFVEACSIELYNHDRLGSALHALIECSKNT